MAVPVHFLVRSPCTLSASNPAAGFPLDPCEFSVIVFLSVFFTFLLLLFFCSAFKFGCDEFICPLRVLSRAREMAAQ